DEPFPFADPLEALRRPRHRLQHRREDRTERDVIRIDCQRALELRMIVRADADPDACVPNRGNIRAFEIALPEMDEAAVLVDRNSPVVVDDQRRAAAGADLERRAHLVAHVLLRAILDPQLDQPRAARDEAPDPVGAVDDRIEAGERVVPGHVSTAIPATGVDGAAISRGSIGPAPYAIAPASTAFANAAAIRTGSAASATAVFKSTAS